MKIVATEQEIVDAIRPFLKHELTCYTQQNWDDALMAMADTPDQLKDEGWHEAYDEIIRKRQTCTCKHEQIKEALKSLPTLRYELVEFAKNWNEKSAFEKITTKTVDRYLATHSKQG